MYSLSTDRAVGLVGSARPTASTWTGDRRRGPEAHLTAARRSMLHILLVVGVILLILWAIGLITGRTLGGLVHVLAVIAVILVVLWLVFVVF
jgi:Family of unknown function (DUF5670)